MTLPRFLASAFLSFCALTSPLWAAKEERPRQRLTFLCADFPRLTRYQTDARGTVDVVMPQFGEVPPAQFFLPGAEDKPVRVGWTSGRLTREILWDSPKGEGLVISVENPAGAGKGPQPSGPTNGKAKSPRKNLLPIATVDLPKGGKPQLVALYQPDLSAKWLPVKTLLLDISPEALPAGSCAVLNLSNLPAQVLLGEGGAPVALAPGASKVLPSPARDADGMVLTRAAVGTTEGPKILSNSPRQMPKEGRHLVVISSNLPVLGGGLPASLRVFRLD